MPTNDFLAFADGVGANVLSQADYAALTTLIDNGFLAGLAQSEQLNKVWRQATVMAYVMGQFTVDQAGLDAFDDGDLATLLANFTQAVRTAAGIPANRIVTSSANMNLLTSDFAVGFNRTAAPAALNATLSAGFQAGQELEVADLAGNMNAFPITIVAPGGDTINGAANFVLNVNFQKALIRYHGSNLWSVKP